MNRTSFDNRPFCSEELLFRDLCWCWTNGTTIRRELYVIAWALTKPSSQPKQLPSPSFTFSFPSPRHMCPFLSSSRSGGQNSLGEFTINEMILSLLFWRSWKKKDHEFISRGCFFWWSQFRFAIAWKISPLDSNIYFEDFIEFQRNVISHYWRKLLTSPELGKLS